MNNRSQSYCFRGIITISFFVFFHPLLNTFASPPTPSKCRPDQRDALLELKAEFRSDNPFVRTASWDKSVDCCSWDGVTCDAISGKVITLELGSYNSTNYTSLKSSSALFKLQHLRSLDLHNCNLQGEIPSSIGNLSHLTFLDLSSNHLVGEVPASIGNLNKLRHIGLLENNFTGNIPSSFANLTKLDTLFLHENQFTGGDIVLANLTNLSFIELSSNNFTSSIFSYLSGLHKLEFFYGSENSFSGFFPSSLLTIPSLVYIDLGRNQFEGPIDFGNTSSLSKLEVLRIGYNNFDGLISKSISKLRNLEYLDLRHNNFVGGVPRSLSKLVNLTSLNLSYNKLEGGVPHCLWTSSKLEFAVLFHNSFTNFGKSVEVVDGASLRTLDLGSNSLQGPIPQWICKLSLHTLVLPNNHLTGSIPPCLKDITTLTNVNLGNNSLSGFLPDFCTNNGSWLRSLDVSHNNLKGKLPKSLRNCTYMVLLNVKGNKIKDKFPFWLGSVTVLLLGSNAFYGPIYNSSVYLGFPNLRIIDISNNNFVGSLPQDYFGNWSQMSFVWSNIKLNSYYVLDLYEQYEALIELVYKGVDTDFDRVFTDFKTIDFSGNRFSGHIPYSIGRLSGLRLLNLSGNAFTGSIPPSLANITTLETLDLSRNNLSGKIPPLLGNLSFLSYINFSHNHLEGLVPQSTQFETQKCSSFAGNSGLYGLDEICGKIHVPVTPTSQQPEESSSETEDEMISWIAAAIACVPGVFCGLVIGHIFTSYKRQWFTSRFF